MLAEIRNKINELDTFKYRKSEDELTGNFFGTLRYMSLEKVLKSLLLKAKGDPQIVELVKTMNLEGCELKLWHKAGGVELDAYLAGDAIHIGFEVKYNSSLSGEDQLVKEGEILAHRFNPGGENILLLVALRHSRRYDTKKLYLENCHRDIFQRVHLGYLFWEDFYEVLAKVKRETDNPYEQCMLQDLMDLLGCKGFAGFYDFSVDEAHKVEADGFYNFESGEASAEGV